MGLKYILPLLFLLFGPGLLQAQNIEYGAGLDTNYMMIGDQQHFVLRVKSDAGIKIVFPQLKDTISKGIEIISGPVRDSVKESDGRWLFEEKYVITVFDSGVYVIPPLPIEVVNDSYNNVLRTEPLAVVVNTYQVDEQKGNYDIVMPYATPWNLAEILPYLLWGILVLAVIGAGWWYWKRRKKNQPLFAAKKEVIPPYVKAIKLLDTIKAEKLWQAGKEKEYYTRLTDTVRQYLDDEFQIPAMEQTSFETLKAIEKYKEVDRDDKDRLAEMLQTADFVKFAKMTPLQDENARYLDTAYDFLNHTNRNVEEERAEEMKKMKALQDAAEKAEKEKAEKEKAEKEKVEKEKAQD